MHLSISQIIDNIFAQSAIAAIIDEDKSRSILTPDHRLVLRSIIQQEFCRLSLSLMPYLADISLPNADSDILEYSFNDPDLNSNSALEVQIQYILTCGTIAAAYRVNDSDVADRFQAMSSALTTALVDRLSTLSLPPALTPWRI